MLGILFLERAYRPALAVLVVATVGGFTFSLIAGFSIGRFTAVLPLIVADRAIGVFVLYTSKREFFEAEGLVLLKELAGNVAFAIDHIEKQEQLDRFLAKIRIGYPAAEQEAQILQNYQDGFDPRDLQRGR